MIWNILPTAANWIPSSRNKLRLGIPILMALWGLAGCPHPDLATAPPPYTKVYRIWPFMDATARRERLAKDLSELPGHDRWLANELLDQLQSPCDPNHTLREGFLEQLACEPAPEAYIYLLDLLKRKVLRPSLFYQARFVCAPEAAAGNARVLRDLTPNGFTRGDLQGPIQLAVFSDFECPSCKNFAKILDSFLKAVKNYNVGLVFLPAFPVRRHKQASAAAAAAWAVGRQGPKKFWAVHDFLFLNQERLGPSMYTIAARSLGVDLDRFQHELPEMQAQVDALWQKAQVLPVDATPTLFVNGCRFQTEEEVQQRNHLGCSNTVHSCGPAEADEESRTRVQQQRLLNELDAFVEVVRLRLSIRRGP